MPEQKPVPTVRERALADAIITYASGFIDGLDGAALTIAEYRAELARDPAFVLAAAEALIREALIEYIEPLYRDMGDREDGFFICAGKNKRASLPGQSTYDEGGETCATLLEAYQKLLASRKERG